MRESSLGAGAPVVRPGEIAGPGATSRGPLVPDAALPYLGIALFLLVFEIITRLDIVPQRFVPPPSVMALGLVQQFGQMSFWLDTWTTLWTWAASLAIAAVLAIPIGILMGASVYVHAALRTLVEFLRPIPSVALIPALILLMGANDQSKIFLSAFSAFWPILIQTLYGVRDVEPLAVETARSFGFSASARLRKIVLPAALPYIATGLRISSALALVVVVTMEIVVGMEGLGRRIVLARQGANVEAVYAIIFWTGVLGLAQNTLFSRIERRVLHWHTAFRGAAQ
ncbi:ABC transporter permease [Arsenicitalea aurantiaca]|uniref:ABC transporter permease n=1 Tax=Arsenicitalea aurantiaca TaxID=1783274 RepID=A0A433X496_9HYPH|nr:ABC transporter permease [Arsenicitalea aurantiaca]RUT28890.1 ABC transporter permease [Arsenicitalea aurantiaca]